MSNQLLITDPEELQSFFAPAYQFSSQEAAEAFRSQTRSKRHQNPQHILQEQGPFQSFYVTLDGSWISRMGTSLLTADPPIPADQFSSPIQLQKLRSKQTLRPSGSHHLTALLIEGRRQYVRPITKDRFTPDWVQQMNAGPQDCYAAWCRYNGESLEPKAVFRDRNDCEKRILTSRSSRGAIYAATTVFDRHGEPAGIETRLFLLECTIFDKARDKDDKLQIKWVCQYVLPARYNPRCLFLDPVSLEPVTQLDRVWKELARKAWRGFTEDCLAYAREIEPLESFYVH